VPAEAQLRGLHEGALVMCTDTCVAVESDGTLLGAPIRAEFPSIAIADPPTKVEVCTAKDACVTLQPNAQGDHVVVDAALDEAGKLAVIAIQDPAHLGPGTLELWDVARSRRQAHGDASEGDPGGVELDVGFVGERIVSVARGGGEGMQIRFLTRKSEKLVEIHHVYDRGSRGWAATYEAVMLLDADGVRRVEVKKDGKSEERPWTIPLCGAP
jgi:hypothetical protein